MTEDSGVVDSGVEGSAGVDSGSIEITEEHGEILDRFGEDPRAILDHLVNLEKSHGELGNRYSNLEKLVSRKVEDFSDEAWDKYAEIRSKYADIPADAGGYDNPLWEFQGVQDESGNVSYPAKSQFQDMCKRHNLSRAQANGLYEEFASYNRGMAEQMASVSQNYEMHNFEDLRQAWGNTYDDKMNSARYYLSNVAPKITGISAEEGIGILHSSGGSSNAWLLKQFAAMGELASSGSSRGYGTNASVSPHDASVRISHIKNDVGMREVMTNPLHPNHKSVMSELESLYKIKHGEV